MQGVASNESIRTARPAPQQTRSDTSPSPIRPRFQDPAIFDLINQPGRRPGLDSFNATKSSCSLTSSPTNHPSPKYPQTSHDSALPDSVDRFSSAARLYSPSSFTPAHQITVISQPGDDPRFVIWGEQNPSTSVQAPAPITSKKRSSAIVEALVQHHGSSSTSNLGLATNLSHIGPNNASTSSDVGVVNVRRWSRTARHHPQPSPTLAHSSSEPMASSSPILAIPFGVVSKVEDNRPLSVNSGEIASSTKPPSSPGSSTSVAPLSGSAATLSTAQRILMAATIERWIAELTTRIDPRALVEFFLTYRAVMRPLDLCLILTCRFEWTILFKSTAYYHNHDLDQPLRPPLAMGTGDVQCFDIHGSRMLIDAKEEAGRRIVKVRTFVMLRHWLLNHFEDDFLKDRSLRIALTSWLNNIIKKLRGIRSSLIHLEAAHSRTGVQGIANSSTSNQGDEDLRILKNLKKVVKQRKEVYLAYNRVEGAQTVGRASASKDGGAHRKKNAKDVRSIFPAEDEGVGSSPLPQHGPAPPFCSNHRKSHSQSMSVKDDDRGRPSSRASSALGQVRDANFAQSDLRLHECETSDQVGHTPRLTRTQPQSPARFNSRLANFEMHMILS